MRSGSVQPALAHVHAPHARAQGGRRGRQHGDGAADARGRWRASRRGAPWPRSPAGRRSTSCACSVPSAATGRAACPRRRRRSGCARGRRCAGRAGSRRRSRRRGRSGTGRPRCAARPCRTCSVVMSRAASASASRTCGGVGAAHAGHGHARDGDERGVAQPQPVAPSTTRTARNAAVARSGGRGRRDGSGGRRIRSGLRLRGPDPAGRRRSLSGVETSTPTLLRDLTTLRLGGPAGRLVEAADEDALVEAVRARRRARASRCSSSPAASNVVRRRRGLPGHGRARRAPRGDRRRRAGGGRVRLEVAGGRAVGRARRRAASRDGLAGRRVPRRASPARSARRRSRTSAPTARRSPRRSRAVRVLDRARGARRDAGARGLRLRLPLERVQARSPAAGSCSRSRSRLERSRASAPVRYAELARALGVGVGDRAPLADVREAVLALRRGKGMVVDPADPDSVSAGSFFTNPILDADAFAALERRVAERSARRRAARASRARRARQDLGRVADRARGLPPRPRRPAAGSRSPPSTRSRSPTAARARRPSSSRSRARSPAACATRFGVELVPEPVFVGHEWPGCRGLARGVPLGRRPGSLRLRTAQRGKVRAGALVPRVGGDSRTVVTNGVYGPFRDHGAATGRRPFPPAASVRVPVPNPPLSRPTFQ